MLSYYYHWEYLFNKQSLKCYLQNYDERGLELKKSQLDACTIQESDSDLDEVHPLFNDQDLSRLTYGLMNRSNQNFERISNLVGQPLSYQDTEDILHASQRDIIYILQSIIECQQQHTTTSSRQNLEKLSRGTF